MLDEAKKLYQSVSTNHRNTYIMAEAIEKLAPQLAGDLKETADMTYALQECFDLAEDTLKTLRKLRGNIDKLFCAMTVAGGAVGKVETEHCEATPKVKMSVSLPSRRSDPEKFAAVMKELGIPENMYSGETEFVRPHFPGMVEYVTNKLANGEPLSAALSDVTRQYPVYSVKISAKKGVLE